MEENVFDSIEAIDAALDSEFGTSAEEPELEEAEQETINTDGEEAEETTETAEEVEEPVENNTQPIEVEDKAESKKDYAFADLRAQNSALKKEKENLEADSKFLKELASSYGYDDVSKFQEAIKNARYEKEAKDKGYDLELYKKTIEQERRIAQLEQEREQELTDRKVQRFKEALDNAVSNYGVDEKEIFDRLEKSGISADEMLSISNPKLLLDGILLDKVKNTAKQSQINELQNMKGLVEDKNESNGNAKQITIESLLKDDLDRYKADNFY